MACVPVPPKPKPAIVFKSRSGPLVGTGMWGLTWSPFDAMERDALETFMFGCL